MTQWWRGHQKTLWLLFLGFSNRHWKLRLILGSYRKNSRFSGSALSDRQIVNRLKCGFGVAIWSTVVHKYILTYINTFVYIIIKSLHFLALFDNRTKHLYLSYTSRMFAFELSCELSNEFEKKLVKIIIICSKTKIPGF